MKKCSKCNEVKSYEFFSKHKRHKDGYQYKCKSCVKQYQQKNKDKIKEQSKQYYEENKEKIKEQTKQYREENKDKVKEQKKQYYEENKEHYKQYREENKEYYKQHNKEYYKKYREENRQKINEYYKNRRSENTLFRLSHNLRTRTSLAFRNKGYSKNTKTQDMLGVEWEVVKMHIERQFKNGMTWSNYGEWHIDHIIPLASANTEEELINLCRYTNLQPLWAEENMSKGCKIEETQLKLI